MTLLLAPGCACVSSLKFSHVSSLEFSQFLQASLSWCNAST